MSAAQAVFYLIAIVLLIIAAFLPDSRVSLALLGASSALLAYCLPGLAAAL